MNKKGVYQLMKITLSSIVVVFLIIFFFFAFSALARDVIKENIEQTKLRDIDINLLNYIRTENDELKVADLIAYYYISKDNNELQELTEDIFNNLNDQQCPFWSVRAIKSNNKFFEVNSESLKRVTDGQNLKTKFSKTEIPSLDNDKIEVILLRGCLNE